MVETFSEEFKRKLQKEHLEDLRERVLVEMVKKPLFTRESCEFLLQTYTDKLAELYY